ncbi:proline dioxygenase [Bacillus sp. MUM 116]|uniref:2OG-Fe(II) oxygenase n=1 Tax=Bacillus sp. MUM 116 TaxID=1678002 RepID=UPI0008F574FC|nr:2OG-Fe(II) oxygenase [Bacillus sp. MUM 116]OIK17013.1 proline dioxygenase [Bacillus sp. MUM 116]
MEKIMHISSDLRDWIVQTLRSGVNPESIVDAMIKKGFDPTFSYRTILRIVGNQTIKTSTLSESPYIYEIPEIGRKGNEIQTNDRIIHLLSRINQPFILQFENLLSFDECDELIHLSKGRLLPSQIIYSKTGLVKSVPGRTSKGMYFKLGENRLIETIENRISELTNIPIENGEGLQVLNYQVGEEYKPHFDYFPPASISTHRGGQRIGTLLIYLNDVPSGGETVFPKAGVSIVPRKGTAVYFHYGNSKGQVDRMSLHTSIPVLEGEKWVATNWIRQGRIY